MSLTNVGYFSEVWCDGPCDKRNTMMSKDF